MSESSDAAEQVVRMMLSGGEVCHPALRLRSQKRRRSVAGAIEKS